MKVSRRSMLQTLSGASLVTAGGLALPSWRAKATTATGIMSVHYNGQTMIKNDGTIQGFPASAADLFIKYSYYESGVLANSFRQIITQGVQTDAGVVINITHQCGRKASQSWLVAQVATDDSVGSNLVGTSSAGSLPTTGKHDVMIQFNSSTGLVLAYLDNAPLPGFVRTAWTGSFLIPYYQTSWGGVLKWSQGAMVNGAGGNYTGEMGEFFLVAGHAIDITNANYRQAFIDASTGLPTRQGDEIIVYDSNFNVVDTITPQIRLWGGADTWLLNSPNWTKPAWNWTNPPVSKIDNGPNAFYVATGALQTTSPLIGDFWGNTGEV